VYAIREMNIVFAEARANAGFFANGRALGIQRQ
jgi:hypothetical protein